MLIEDVARIVLSLAAPFSVSIVSVAAKGWLQTWIERGAKIVVSHSGRKVNVKTSDADAKRILEALAQSEGVGVSLSTIEAAGEIEISDIRVKYSSPLPSPPPPPPPVRRNRKQVSRKEPLPPRTVTQEEGRLVVISPTFKLVFLTVVGLTVGLALGAVTVAYAGAEHITQNQQSVFESMSTAWKLGLGAIFGLLGGKALT